LDVFFAKLFRDRCNSSLTILSCRIHELNPGAKVAKPRYDIFNL
jgi:hypothetical protein